VHFTPANLGTPKFPDEVRALGRLLEIPENLVNRHPFPGPGLAIRILGPVTREQVKIAQKADTIYIDEIRKAGLYNQISQAFAVLLPVKAVGVMGDKRTYEQVIVLRAVQTEDFMTADWYAWPLIRPIYFHLLIQSSHYYGIRKVLFPTRCSAEDFVENYE